MTCCRTCRARRGAVTPCLPAQTTASSSRREASTAASTRSTPSTWTRDGHLEPKNGIRITLFSEGRNAACMMCGGGQSQQRHTVYSRLRLAELSLFLTDVKNMSEWSFNGRSKRVKLTRGRAAGKLANTNGQRGNVVKF